MHASFRFLVFTLCLVVASCKSTKPDPVAPVEEAVEAASEEVALPKTDALQETLSTLRKAVSQRDMPVIASLMTSSFGYSLNPLREGDGVFAYWDEKGLWGELELILNEEFVPLDNFMVSPPEFAMDPENYRGYRAGLVNTPAGWRFAYFVTD